MDNIILTGGNHTEEFLQDYYTKHAVYQYSASNLNPYLPYRRNGEAPTQRDEH